jgi:hypothetical protein
MTSKTISVPVGEWLPDLPDFQNPGSPVIQNVVPKSPESYGPISGISTYSGALGARCQGSYAGLDSSGNVNIFAGDATKLYRLVSGTTSWASVNSTSSTYSIASDSMWKFTFMNGRVIATDFADVPQNFLVDSATQFATLSSGAPKARYCAVVKNFLALANTSDSTYGTQPQAVWWSALNDPTNFPTPGTAAAQQVQSDFNNLYGEGGWIQGIVGNLGTADGAVFMEHAVWSMVYAGPPGVFSFLPAEGVRGTPAPNSIVQLGAIVYYLGEDGFYAFDGTNSIPIGANKVDKYFYTNVDQSNMFRIVGAADPLNKNIIWAVPWTGNVSGNPNVLFIYNWVLNRWSMAFVTVETIGRTLSFGYTLDQLDTFGTLDTLPFSLDSRIWTGGGVSLGAFDANHKLNFFNGTNLSPTVQTSETQPFPGKRGLIRSARPLVDGGTPSIAIATRDLITNAPVFGNAVALNALGSCPQYTSGRYLRGQIALPAGSSFSHIQGIEVEGEEQGEQ